MYAAFVKRAYSAGRDGEELVESYLPAFAPKPGSGIRKRIRDELNYRTQIGYTRFWLLPATYGRHRMPNPWPWAVHPLIQFPFVLTLESFRAAAAAARPCSRPRAALPAQQLVPE